MRASMQSRLYTTWRWTPTLLTVEPPRADAAGASQTCRCDGCWVRPVISDAGLYMLGIYSHGGWGWTPVRWPSC
jgi:hypothetical protein